MKKKKSAIILLSVVAVCVLGLIASQVFDWNVDFDNASGNVAKSSRFSRKTAGDGDSNMQELLLNDEEYKAGIVTAYMVMKTRADQFNALVDMSNEVAGDIKDFDAVLQAMKDAQPMIDNVCASMEAAGADLDAALGGETRKDLAQNTSNAALAYNLLQKQNNLANRFIDTADAYLKSNAGDDRLKFVRDQWLEYQKVTAILEQDEKAAAELGEKDYLLSSEKSASALNSFSGPAQAATISNTFMTNMMGLGPQLQVALANTSQGGLANTTQGGLANTTQGGLANTTQGGLANTTQGGLANTTQGGLANTTQGGLANTTQGGLANTTQGGLANTTQGGLANTTQGGLANTTQGGLANTTQGSLNNLVQQGLANEAGLVVINSMAGLVNLQNAAQEQFVNNSVGAINMSAGMISNQVAGVINAMATESATQLNFHK